ncbi:MAG: Ig-like domain-containing protein [Candidatus Thermoplasmatota archaeon]|nr:Ig-like domain-containing protein [Candidatus Thermoplasmatota archaeon]
MKRTLITIFMVAMLALTFGQFMIPASSERQENHAPAAEITDPIHGDNVAGIIEIKIRVSDHDGIEEIKTVNIRIDDGEWAEAVLQGHGEDPSLWVYEWDTTAIENGAHHIRALACDGEGPGEEVVVGVMVQNEEVNRAPAVEIIEPTQGETVSGVVNVRVRVTDLDGKEDIEKVHVKIDDGEWNDAILQGRRGEEHSLWVYEWDTTAVENGEYHVFAVAWDGKDFGEEDGVGVLVQNVEENHAPVVEIIEPAHGKTVNGVVNVKVRASDLDGKEDIKKVHVKIDDGEWNDAILQGHGEDHSLWVYNWNTTTVENGEHHISAKAYDHEDDGEADVIGVIVNNTEENHKPVAEIVEIHQGATVSGVVEVWIKASDVDGIDDIEQVFVWIDDNEWQNATFLRNGEGHSLWVYEWDTTLEPNGEHHIWTIAYDAVDEGEENWVGVFVENIVENQIPRAEFIEPGAGARVHGIVRVTVAASDPDGNDNLEMVFVRIDDGEWQNATFHNNENGNSLWIIEWNTSAVENGEHHIQTSAFDGEDDSHVHTIGVFIHNEINENHPPTARIIDVEPIINGHLSGVVDVWIRVSDPDGLDEIVLVETRVDEGPWQPARQVGHERDFT